jgi:hypothetical protein
MVRKPKKNEEIKVERPERARLSEKESLKRLEEFPRRKEKLIAAVRKGKSCG